MSESTNECVTVLKVLVCQAADVESFDLFSQVDLKMTPDLTGNIVFVGDKNDL